MTAFRVQYAAERVTIEAETALDAARKLVDERKLGREVTNARDERSGWHTVRTDSGAEVRAILAPMHRPRFGGPSRFGKAAK